MTWWEGWGYRRFGQFPESYHLWIKRASLRNFEILSRYVFACRKIRDLHFRKIAQNIKSSFVQESVKLIWKFPTLYRRGNIESRHKVTNKLLYSTQDEIPNLIWINYWLFILLIYMNFNFLTSFIQFLYFSLALVFNEIFHLFLGINKVLGSIIVLRSKNISGLQERTL